MGRNYTIYVSHDEFDKEPNKSGLVNELLREHYGKPDTYLYYPLRTAKKHAEEALTPAISASTDTHQTSNPVQPKPIKTPEQAAEAVKPLVSNKEFRTCKNGHPIPAGSSKCLGKGCKYAV